MRMTMRAEVAWPRPGDPTEEQYEALGRALPGLAAIIDDGHLYLYARWTLEAGDLGEAVSLALTQARNAYAATFGSPAEPAQIAIAPANLGLIPGPMDLVGTTGVGEILGAKRQYASQLHREGKLPAPLGYPSSGPVWVRRVVEIAAAARRTARS